MTGSPAAAAHALTLRLLARRGRVITSRAAIVAAAARARRGGQTYTLWPDARQPMIAADMGYPPAAEWLRCTMVPTLRRLPDAAAWMSLRARAALIAERDGLAVEVGNAVAGAPLRVAMFSPSGQAVSKAICFLFREGEDEPRIVVKAMAEPRFGWRLRRESAQLECIRKLVQHDTRATGGLPPAPLAAADAHGEFMLAEPFDSVGTATGSGSREQALEWLRAFHGASCSRERPWDADDERAVLVATRDAWHLASAGTTHAVLARVKAHSAALRGTAVPRCAIHGDFWRGNVAARGRSIRVYDWEWAALDGSPLFDLWTYELADLRVRAREDEWPLDEYLRGALERVRSELRRRSLDERLALVTLAPVLGALSFRIRTELDMPDEMEPHSIALMSAAERLLLSG